MTNKKTKLISGITATVVVASAVGIGVGTSFAINSEREVDQLRAISNAKIFPILKQMPFGGVENSSNPIKFLEAFNAKRLDTNLSPNALPIWNNSNFVSFDIVEMAKISGISETVLDNFSFKVEKAIISNANPNNLNLTIIVVSKNDSTLFTKYEILISDFLSEESYIQKAADIISTKIRTSNITTTNLIAQRTLASKVIASQLSDFIRDNIPFNNLVDANDISYAFEILSSNDNLGNIEAKITIIPRFSIERIVLESITLNGFSTTTNQEIIQIQNNIQNASELSFNFTPQAEILTIDNVNSNNIQNLAKLTQNPNPGLKYEIQTDSLIINKETNLINFDVLISDASGRNVETTKRYKTSVTFRPFTIFAFDQLDFVIKGEKLNQFLSQELNTLDFVPATNPNSNLTYTVQSTRIISFNSVLLTIRVVQNNTSNSQTYETIVNAGFSSIQNRQNAILTLIKEQEPAPISKIVLENTLASNVHPSNFNNPDFSNIIPLSLRNLPNFFPAITYSILNSDNANGTLDLRVNVSLPGMPQIGYTSKFNTLKSNDFVQNLIQLISNRKLSPILKTLTPSITIPTISLESIANDLVAPNQAQLMSGNNRITLPEGAVVTFEINRNTGTQGVLNPNDINGTLDISINFTLKLLGDVAIYQGNYTVTMTGFSSQELRNLENIAKFQSLGLRPIYNNPSVLASNLLPSNINLNNLNQFQVPVFDQVAFPDLTLRIKSILNPNNVLGSIDVTVEQKIIKNGITTTRDNVITIFGFRTESADNALSVITNYINTINGSDGQVVIKFKNTVNPNETLIASLTQNDVDFEPFNFGENELFPSLSAEVSAIRINPQDPTIAQILILVKSNVLVNGQNVQQVYIQNIPGFAPQEFIINREILKQYIENGNLSNTLISPILLPTIVKNLTLPNTVSLSSFETTTLSDPSNPNINLRLIGVAQGVVNPITNPPVATSVVATISASLGTGDSVVTQTYIVTIEGFATPIGMANQTIANNEVANIASRAVASLRDEAKKTLSVSQLLPSDFNLRYPANSTSIVPISDLSITQIEADPNDSTIAVLTIQVIIRVNSFNNSLNFGIATYTQKIPGFLNQDSGRIALGFRDLALNANDLIIFNGIKGDTGVDAAIQSGKDNFTINSPIGFENIIFSIQDFDSTSTNASRGELGFVIKGEFNGQILLSSTINQKIVVSEFLAENLAILNAATEFGVILKPEFNLNSNRPTASQASKDNFSINFSQAPDPRVEYEITNLV
nr:truncated adhesin protein [[Mycoplasma] mobile]